MKENVKANNEKQREKKDCTECVCLHCDNTDCIMHICRGVPEDAKEYDTEQCHMEQCKEFCQDAEDDV